MPKTVKRIAIVVVVLALLVGGFVFKPDGMGLVSIAAEPIFDVFGFPITNSIITAWLVMAFLVILSYFATRNMKEEPTGLQNLVEYGFEAVKGLVDGMAGEQRGRKFLPLIATIFVFVMFSNWFGLLPFFGTVGQYHEVHANHEVQTTQSVEAMGSSVQQAVVSENGGEAETVLVPFLRSPSTDLNFTLALALISVASMQYFGVKGIGFKKYASKFINVHGPINMFVGILELISEFAKIISLAFRLFGNIFAGEVLLLVIGFLVPWLGIIPFLGLELFIGVIQAFVFAILTLVFLVTATTAHDESH